MNSRILLTVLALFLHVTGWAAEPPGWQPLLSANTLNQLLQDSTLKLTVVDIRPLDSPVPGGSYNAGHLPRAISSPYPNWRGPKENPGKMLSASQLTALVQGLGADAETPVVVVYLGDTYSDFGAAARVYWSLKTAGLQHLAILDGGYLAWKKAGLPVSTQRISVEPSGYVVTLDPTWLATTAEIEQQLDQSDVSLLDARPSDFFEGNKWHGASARPGTIAGASDFDNKAWFVDGGSFLRSSTQLQTLAREQGLDQAAVTVSFCNTGHWAATNWFVLSEVVGQPGVKLYPESMVEWSNQGLPMDHVPGRLKWLWLSTRQWLGSAF